MLNIEPNRNKSINKKEKPNMLELNDRLRSIVVEISLSNCDHRHRLQV